MSSRKPKTEIGDPDALLEAATRPWQASGKVDLVIDEPARLIIARLKERLKTASAQVKRKLAREIEKYRAKLKDERSVREKARKAAWWRNATKEQREKCRESVRKSKAKRTLEQRSHARELERKRLHSATIDQQLKRLEASRQRSLKWYANRSPEQRDRDRQRQRQRQRTQRTQEQVQSRRETQRRYDRRRRAPRKPGQGPRLTEDQRARGVAACKRWRDKHRKSCACGSTIAYRSSHCRSCAARHRWGR